MTLVSALRTRVMKIMFFPVTCILVFLLISYVIPMMGYLAQILGIGFPLLLLIYLHRAGSGEAQVGARA